MNISRALILISSLTLLWVVTEFSGHGFMINPFANASDFWGGVLTMLVIGVAALVTLIVTALLTLVSPRR